MTRRAAAPTGATGTTGTGPRGMATSTSDPEDPAELLAGIRSGDRRALARAITLAESTRSDHRQAAEVLLDGLAPTTGSSIRIGVSGAPGVGKSTFVEALGLHVVGLGHRLAVLAVDPSSTRSGGSILADKTRMGELSRDDSAFIRPSPGSGRAGGVAPHTRDAILLCEAAGHDVVIVETVGVGQSEVAVADMVDVFCLLVSPAGGDEIQGIKRGIMEIADLVVVNKADGELTSAAARTESEYRSAVQLLRPRWRAWTTEVISCSALHRRGIDDVWETVERFREAVGASGELDEARSRQATAAMWAEVRDSLLTDLRSSPAVEELLPRIEADVAGGRLSPGVAARRIREAFRGSTGLPYEDPARGS